MGRKKREFTEEEKNQILELYLKDRESIVYISGVLHVRKPTLKKFLVSEDIRIMPPGRFQKTPLSIQDFTINDSGCHVWSRGKSKAGYGMIRLNGRPAYAHRVAYVAARGPITRGKDLDHLCRNRACINPDHLEEVSRKTNIRRGSGTLLDEIEVREIKSLRGKISQRGIAEIYDVSSEAVASIMSGRSWKDI